MSTYFPGHIKDLAAWRAHLFKRMMNICIPITLVTALPGTAIHFLQQDWGAVATGIGAMMWIAYVYFRRHDHVERLIAQLIVMLYIVGLVMLSKFGEVAYIYFMALPLLAVIFISNRAALGCSTINAVTLLIGWYVFRMDEGSPAPAEYSSGQHLIFTFSFVFISGLLTWACGMLLDGAKRLLEIQVESTKAFEMLALQDPLTQLANRRMLQQGLTQEIARSKRNGRPFVIALIDLDRFKEINDTYGHQSGDELLKAVAGRIRQFVRSGDMVVRLGGDEFVVLIHNYEGEAAFQNVLMRLLDKTSGEYIVNERTLTVGVSVGVAVYPRDGRDQQELLKNADIALYQAKASGSNCYRFFSDVSA